MHNALAARNTQLLRTYSLIDQRVRWLAYTLKKWVKARHLNDPSDGTLSSYGKDAHAVLLLGDDSSTVCGGHSAWTLMRCWFTREAPA